jgi:hypothetical protein
MMILLVIENGYFSARAWERRYLFFRARAGNPDLHERRRRDSTIGSICDVQWMSVSERGSLGEDAVTEDGH